MHVECTHGRRLGPRTEDLERPDGPPRNKRDPVLVLDHHPSLLVCDADLEVGVFAQEARSALRAFRRIGWRLLRQRIFPEARKLCGWQRRHLGHGPGLSVGVRVRTSHDGTLVLQRHQYFFKYSRASGAHLEELHIINTLLCPASLVYRTPITDDPLYVLN